MLKHFFSRFLIISLIISSLVIPKKSEAVLGISLITGGAGALVLAGAAWSLSGGTIATIAGSSMIVESRRAGDSFAGTIVVAIGLALLGTNYDNFQLSRLTEEQVKNYRLVANELTAYNREIDDLNVIGQSLAKELKDGNIKAEDINNKWNEAVENKMVTQEAYNVLQKIIKAESKETSKATENAG